MDLYNAALGQDETDEPIELTLEQYQEAKDHYEGIIARGQAAKNLSQNPDFVALIMEGYLTNEGLRLSELITSGRINNQSVRDNVMKDMEAIGSFRNYMKMHTDQAAVAVAELADLNEAWEIALREEAGE